MRDNSDRRFDHRRLGPRSASREPASACRGSGSEPALPVVGRQISTPARTFTRFVGVGREGRRGRRQPGQPQLGSGIPDDAVPASGRTYCPNRTQEINFESTSANDGEAGRGGPRTWTPMLSSTRCWRCSTEQRRCAMVPMSCTGAWVRTWRPEPLGSPRTTPWKWSRSWAAAPKNSTAWSSGRRKGSAGRRPCSAELSRCRTTA